MENRNRTVTIAVIVGVIALLLGLFLGALAGGLGGYFIGHKAAPQAVERLAPRIELPPTIPQPQLPQPQRTPTPIPRAPDARIPEMLRQGGALVQNVVKGTPADEAGLRAGDMISRVNNTAVDADHRLADILREFKPGDRIVLTVWSGGQTRTVRVVLGKHPDDATRAYLGIEYMEFNLQRQMPNPGQ